ncbi:MAG: MerR family transcriptional regulator, partial [Calditrichaeota bacterium]
MKKQNKQWYRIGEVARKLDIAVETIRMYEREGILLIEKTATGQRIFTNEDLNWLRCIRKLIKEERLNIEGIRRL